MTREILRRHISCSTLTVHTSDIVQYGIFTFMQSIQSFRDVLSLISQNIIYFIYSWSDSSTRNKEPVISVFVAEMVVKHN